MSSIQHQIKLMPRVIRAKDAHIYLGMDRNRFNHEVKPHLVAVPIGTQGIGYDRFDLDAWWEVYKERNGQPGALCKMEGEAQWENECQVSTAGRTSPAVCGTSTKSSSANAFAKAVERATKKKQKGS